MVRESEATIARKALWRRWHRRVVVLLLVGAVVTGIFVSLGVAAALFAVALGIATFSTGAPKDNGPVSPPSIPYPGQR